MITLTFFLSIHISLSFILFFSFSYSISICFSFLAAIISSLCMTSRSIFSLLFIICLPLSLPCFPFLLFPHLISQFICHSLILCDFLSILYFSHFISIPHFLSITLHPLSHIPFYFFSSLLKSTPGHSLLSCLFSILCQSFIHLFSFSGGAPFRGALLPFHKKKTFLFLPQSLILSFSASAICYPPLDIHTYICVCASDSVDLSF